MPFDSLSIMAQRTNARGDTYLRFGMEMEFLLRKNPIWQTMLGNTLFTNGGLVELVEHNE